MMTNITERVNAKLESRVKHFLSYIGDDRDIIFEKVNSFIQENQSAYVFCTGYNLFFVAENQVIGSIKLERLFERTMIAFDGAKISESVCLYYNPDSKESYSLITNHLYDNNNNNNNGGSHESGCNNNNS